MRRQQPFAEQRTTGATGSSGETLVSRTMRDLVAGSRAALHAPRGLPELVDPRPQPSIDVRHEVLTRYFRTLVVAIGLARRQRDFDGVQVLVRDSRQQMCDAIEPGLFLVVGVRSGLRWTPIVRQPEPLFKV